MRLYAFLEVGAQLVRGSGLPGVVSGREDAAGERTGALEAGDVVALPAVDGYSDLCELLECPLRVDAELCVRLARGLVSCLDSFVVHAASGFDCRRLPAACE